MSKTRLIEGGAGYPFFVRDLNGKRQESNSVIPFFEECEKAGVTRMNIAYSSRYYIRHEDGWYVTTDSEACDRMNGLPPEGRLIYRPLDKAATVPN